MTTAKINQKEYLKKYLSSNIGDEKKKKKKKKSKKTVKIIDDDIDLSKIETNENDLDIYQTGEDAPQIVGVIDDRPPELQALDYQNSNKWKAVNNDNFSKMLDSSKPSSSRNKLLKESSPLKKSKKNKRNPDFLDNDLSPYTRRDGNNRSDSSPRKTSKTEYSPERRKNKDDQSSKQKTRPKYSDNHLSPKRYMGQKDSDTDLSPRRNKRYSEGLSPKRLRNRRDIAEDFSPKRIRNRHNDDYDLSPKRSKQSRYVEDLSPSRKHKHLKTSDSSPKRSRSHKNSNKIISPKRNKSLPDSVRDISPKQNRTSITRDVDLSPRRHQNRGYSPKRTKKSRFDAPYQRRSTSRDSSPNRRTPPKAILRSQLSRSRSFDLSPPRKSSNKLPDRMNKRRDNYSRNSPSPPRHIKIKQEDDSPPPTHSKMMTKTLDGKSAGLSDAKALRVENAKFKDREQKLFEKMTDEMSGRHADVVMRDRSTGKRRNFEEESEKQRKKDEKETAKKVIYDRWGAGLKQVEEHKVRLEEISHEMNKPLARYSNDEDLDAYLKKQERHGDPMLEYIRQKEREKNKKQGIPEMPKYEGSFPDNRFNIPPGYRWDGVDRSNGFEKKWFETISKKKAVEEEAYRYSTEDM